MACCDFAISKSYLSLKTMKIRLLQHYCLHICGECLLLRCLQQFIDRLSKINWISVIDPFAEIKGIKMSYNKFDTRSIRQSWWRKCNIVKHRYRYLIDDRFINDNLNNYCWTVRLSPTSNRIKYSVLLWLKPRTVTTYWINKE